MYWAMPTSSFGYYRGSPQAGGGAQSGGGYGPQRMAQNQFAQGQGPTQQAGAWTPTILYLVALVILEMAVFAFIARRI